MTQANANEKGKKCNTPSKQPDASLNLAFFAACTLHDIPANIEKNQVPRKMIPQKTGHPPPALFKH
jgi:hypothetical protein